MKGAAGNFGGFFGGGVCYIINCNAQRTSSHFSVAHSHVQGTLTACLVNRSNFGGISECVSGGFVFLCFFFFLLSGWQAGGLDSRVERHSLCPVLTSLDFKWPTGRSRLPFTSHHLHFPLHTVTLTVTHKATASLHTSHSLGLAHEQYKYLSTCFLSSYFQRKQKYTVLYKPLTIIHKHICAHGINTACGHILFLLECPFFIQSAAINHPVITHSCTYKPANLFLTYIHANTNTCSLYLISGLQ